MCTVSNHLKLCTCGELPEEVKHYWALFRYVEGKEEVIMGSPIMPADIHPETNQLNRELLLRLLNEVNAFDKPIYPQEKDRLLISFDVDDVSRLNYGFTYHENKWQQLPYDYFDWHTRHDNIKMGKIAHPFVRKASQ
jgi:hypothetical protein